MEVSSSSSRFQVDGLVSKLDTSGIVSQLMTLEKAPLDRLDQRQAEFNQQPTTWRSVNARLLGLHSVVSRLADESLFGARTATSGNRDILTATADSGQDLGAFSVTVQQLATRHQVISQ